MDPQSVDLDIVKLVRNFFEMLGSNELDAMSLISRPEHEEFAERIKKSLYYGKLPTDDRPSLPMTEIAVNYIRDAAPRELGKIDMYLASDIGKRAYVSPCSMMLGMVYIERLKHKNPDYLNTVSSSDLFLISMMLASKYLYDEGIDEEVYNDEWAEAAHLNTADINALEVDFLRAIDWSLFTTTEEFERLLKSMEESTAYMEGFRRGFWTYTDVMILLQNAQLNSSILHAMSQLCKVVAVCSIAYTAGLLTVMASMTTLTLLKTHSIPVTMVTTGSSHLGDVAAVTNGSGHLDDVMTVSEEDNEAETDIAMDEETNSEATDGDSNDTALSYSTLTEGGPMAAIFTDHGFNQLLIDEILDHESNVTTKKESVSTGLTLPGLLTLTLIKDTVSHFLVALKSDGNEVDNEMVADVDGCEIDTAKCTCPQSGCDADYLNEPKQMTSFGQCISPYTFWTSLRYYAKYHAKLHNLKPMKNKSNLICVGGPCRVETNMKLTKANEISEWFNKFSKMKFCRNSAEENGADLRCWFTAESSDQFSSFQLQETVAVDLLLGFHTTGFVMS